VKVNDANQRGPHWADPLKAWGDVLVKQDKTKEALAKYNELSSSRRTGSNSKKRAKRRRNTQTYLDSLLVPVVAGSMGVDSGS
jgi:hypothetical protein